MSSGFEVGATKIMKAMKNKASSLMTHMTPNPVTVTLETSLDDVIRIMKRYGFRHLPVTSCNEVVGIVSDRDLRLATSMLPSRSRLLDEAGHQVPGARGVREIMTENVYCLSWNESPARAAKEMVRRQIGAIPIVEDAGILGIVTETNLLQAYVELCWINDGACDVAVEERMSRPLPFVQPTTSIEDALGQLDQSIGHLGVLEGSQLIGILSQRDLLMGLSREMIADAKSQAAGELLEPCLSVASVMTAEVLTAEPQDSLCICAKTMVRRHVSALPVIENGQPVGILTQRNILEAYAELLSD